MMWGVIVNNFLAVTSVHIHVKHLMTFYDRVLWLDRCCWHNVDCFSPCSSQISSRL